MKILLCIDVASPPPPSTGMSYPLSSSVIPHRLELEKKEENLEMNIKRYSTALISIM
jgi:hypothetical protein